MTKRQRFVDDVEFIFSECVRLQGLLAKDIKAIPKEELWPSLPHPSGGGGLMLCGRAAQEKIIGLAEEAGRRTGITRRVRLETLRKVTGDLLVQRFLREKREVNVQQVDRLLNSVGKEALKHCRDTVHLVPCHLMLAKDPDEIRVGPVIFRNRTAFRHDLAARVRTLKKVQDKEERRFDRRLMFDALKYYKTFNWVAEVEVRGCETDTSAAIAKQAVTSALDCLHVLLGAQWTDRMRVGGPGMRRDKRAKLTVTNDGQLEISVSYGGLGQVNFPEGWSKMLAEPDLQRSLRLTGLAIEAAVDPDLDRPIGRRFLDAAQWFGEAAREESPSTRIVKYVTAIERMVMTDEKDDITLLVSERVSALCFRPHTVEEREKWRSKARAAYTLRSKLVHGSISPTASEVRRGVGLAADLAEATLLNALHSLGEHALQADEAGSRRLAEWYTGFVEWADRIQTTSE